MEENEQVLSTTAQIQKFTDFFEQFYKAEILEAARKGEGSFYFDFVLLSKFDPSLSDLLLEQPEEVLKAAEMSLESFDLPDLPVKLALRLKNLPESQKVLIRELRSKHLSKLIKVEGIVRQKSDVRPQVTTTKFECPSCGNIIPVLQLEAAFKEPSRCGCGRKGKFRLLSKELMDVQSMTIEEVPEDLEGGAQPKRIKIFLQKDLVSPLTEKRSNPGKQLIVVGMLKEIPITLKTGGQSTRFDLLIEANSIETTQQDFADIKLSPEDMEAIKDLSKDPQCYERIVGSLVPSIYGHDLIKESLLLLLVGGVKKERDDGVTTRGDIHILLIGDPGAGKSMMLKRINVIAPKSRFISGKGASGAGLCVAPDSLVHGNPGGMDAIGGLVEGCLTEGSEEFRPGIWKSETSHKKKVLSMDKDLKVGTKQVKDFWRLKAPENMVRITTRTGRSITLTGNTKLTTMKGGIPRWKKSSLLKEGEYLAVQRFTPEKEGIIPLAIDCISSNPIVLGIKPVVRSLIQNIMDKEGLTKRELAVKYGFSENQLYTSWTNEKARGNIRLKDLRKLASIAGVDRQEIAEHANRLMLRRGKEVSIPKHLGPEFMYMAGLVAGDGDITGKGGRCTIRLSNNDTAIIKKFKDSTRSLFGAECSLSHERSDKRSEAWRFSSAIAGELFREVGIPPSPKSHRLDMTNILLEAPNDCLSAYLRGLFDSDGSISLRKTKGSCCIDLTTVSPLLAKKVQLALTRFGIIATLRTRGPSVNGRIHGRHEKLIIEIRGKMNLEQFRERIGFGSNAKKRKLDSAIGKVSIDNTNIDIIPDIHPLLLNIKKKYRLTSRQIFGNKISESTTGKCQISRKSLGRIIGRIGGLIRTEDREKLKSLAESDILWDRITKKEIIPSPYEYVYDLTVDDTHNFLVNGFIVHNTATVVKDEFIGGWSLEAGALVLAHKGLCAIDELDKMSKEDTAAMHEALEGQSVTISKASIQATLRCETTVLAAANPKYGRFDPYLTIAEQITLPPTLINRFDLIFPIKDVPDEKRDEKMASFVLNLHQNIFPDNPEFSTDFLRKYIAYAKRHCKPKLTDGAIDEIRKYYLHMRGAGNQDGSKKAIPISARQLEGLIRLSEGVAKVYLAPKVSRKHAKRAIGLLDSCMRLIAYDEETGSFDIDMVATGMKSSQRNKIVSVKEIIADLEAKIGKVIPVEDIVKAAEEQDIEANEVEEVIEKLRRTGDVFEPKRGFISRI